MLRTCSSLYSQAIFIDEQGDNFAGITESANRSRSFNPSSKVHLSMRLGLSISIHYSDQPFTSSDITNLGGRLTLGLSTHHYLISLFHILEIRPPLEREFTLLVELEKYPFPQSPPAQGRTDQQTILYKKIVLRAIFAFISLEQRVPLLLMSWICPLTDEHVYLYLSGYAINRDMQYR